MAQSAAAPAAASAFLSDNKVVRNDASVTAVFSNSSSAAALLVAIWPLPAAGAPKPIVVNGGGAGWALSVDSAPMGGLIAVTVTDADLLFAASIPSNAAGQITFTIDRTPHISSTGNVSCAPNPSGPGTQVTIVLPGGALAGSTVQGRC